MDLTTVSNRDRRGFIGSFVVINILAVILPCIAIGLRIWSRLISRTQGFWYDDWLAIAAVVRTTAL